MVVVVVIQLVPSRDEFGPPSVRSMSVSHGALVTTDDIDTRRTRYSSSAVVNCEARPISSPADVAAALKMITHKNSQSRAGKLVLKT